MHDGCTDEQRAQPGLGQHPYPCHGPWALHSCRMIQLQSSDVLSACDTYVCPACCTYMQRMIKCSVCQELQCSATCMAAYRGRGGGRARRGQRRLWWRPRWRSRGGRVCGQGATHTHSKHLKLLHSHTGCVSPPQATLCESLGSAYQHPTHYAPCTLTATHGQCMLTVRADTHVHLQPPKQH